jgi:sulfocyanin SoxE-like protein
MRLSPCCPHAALFALLGATPLAAQSPGAAEPAPWIAADSAARTASITLEVTAPAGSPSALLNGYREGGVQIVVPLRWTVTWDWRSADSAGKHSLVVMAEREKLPTEGGRPAFTNAMSRSLIAGLAAGQSDHTTFEAEAPGWYWLLCGVPGHAIVGEWIGLRIDPEATTAGVKEKREQ